MNGDHVDEVEEKDASMVTRKMRLRRKMHQW